MTEEENKGLQAKVESLESIVRMLELKAKNATDHGNYSIQLKSCLIQTPFNSIFRSVSPGGEGK